MDNYSKKKLLEGLKTITTEGFNTARMGICGNLERLNCTESIEYTEILDKVSEMSQTWQHYSGNPEYPVESNKLRYNRYANKWTGEHGRMRKDLLKYLIKTLEKELEN